jgi:protein TonB
VRARGRLGASLAASALAHALAVALVVRAAVAPRRPPALVIPVGLVGRLGGGRGAAESGGGTPAASPEIAPSPAAPTPPATAPARPPETARHVVAARKTPTPVAPAPAEAAARGDVASTGGGAGMGAGSGGAAGNGDAGAGDGAGGDGTGGARVAYGMNPLPPYPLVARRLGKEGLVVLEVLVAPDGRPTDVRVVQSTGFPALDESALSTVRERWRFVPARRHGVGVESRVTVPIRFRLDDAHG